MKFAEKFSEVVEANPIVKKIGIGVGVAAAMTATGVVVYKLGNINTSNQLIGVKFAEAAPEVAEAVADVAENVIA